MSPELTRRAFIGATTALVGAARWPAAGTAPAQKRGPVLLFQGDSVTDGGRDRAAAEPNTASGLGTGYPLLVASTALAAHPDRSYRFYNRGISGNKVPDLQQRWAADTIALHPDILSILIGVNDFWHTLTHGYTGTVQEYENQYSLLLEQTRQALPNVRLIVLEPFALRCGAVDDRWFPAFDARRAAAARVAARARAIFVALQGEFDQRARTVPPQYWAADGVHPTAAGHAVIAEQCRRAAGL